MQSDTFVYERLILIISICSNLMVHVSAYHSEYLEQNYPSDVNKKPTIRAHHRIYYGFTAREGEFPSFVSVIGSSNKTGALVSGVAISEKLILTSGHFGADKFNKIEVAQTIWHPNLWYSQGVKTYLVDKLCGKPKYRRSEDGYPLYDYQVLRLKEQIRGIKQAILPATQVRMGYHATIAGVGLIDDSPPETPEKLQYLPVERVPCGEYEHPSRVCFQSYETDRLGGVCIGDSGGPVYGRTKDDRDIVIGLVSFKTGKCHHTKDRLVGSANLFPELEVILNIAKKCLDS